MVDGFLSGDLPRVIKRSQNSRLYCPLVRTEYTNTASLNFIYSVLVIQSIAIVLDIGSISRAEMRSITRVK